MVDPATGWNSGSCGGRVPAAVVAAVVDGPDTDAGDARAAAAGWRPADAWSTAPSMAAAPGGNFHLPLCRSWRCAFCGRDWPCPPLRVMWASAMPRTVLARTMANYLHAAAADLTGLQPGQLFDRFLLWTRRR